VTSRARSTAYYDPYVDSVAAGGTAHNSLSWQEVQDRCFDSAVLLTAHHGVDYQLVGSRAGFILDTHHSLGNLTDTRVVGL
jgi:hypothetical protein